MSAHVAQSYQIKIARASCRIRYPCFAAIVTHLHTPRCRPLVRCSAAAPCVDVTSYQWTGRDEFTDLDDRKELDPLPLPTISTHKRIVLVRHGQSTWNAEGRIQGSTDFAVLTKKGQDQAATTHEMLSNERFDKLITSPLARATETADIIWQEMGGPRSVLPALREIDLYSFQGLLKADGIAKYGREFKTWQQQPAEFEIDGRKPVVELWHRASMAWHDILLDDEVQSCVLVVAHNAVNQALVATATGLGPQFFRRLLQSNAASTVLDFVPRQGGGPPVVTIDRLNQSPGRQFLIDAPGEAPRKRIVLVRHAATASSEETRLHSDADEPCSSLGEVQAVKAAEFLMDAAIDNLFVSPAERAVYTAAAIAKCQSLTGDRAPRLQVVDALRNIEVGSYSGRLASEVQQQSLPEDAENLSDFWARIGSAYELAAEAAQAGATTCIVAHAAVHSALICRCLGLAPEDMGKFRMSTAGVTVIEFPFGGSTGVIRCHNYTAALGRWSVPISRDDQEMLVCGIDGCF